MPLRPRITPALKSVESNMAQNIAKFMINKNYSLTAKGINRTLQDEYK